MLARELWNSRTEVNPRLLTRSTSVRLCKLTSSSSTVRPPSPYSRSKKPKQEEKAKGSARSSASVTHLPTYPPSASVTSPAHIYHMVHVQISLPMEEAD
ncbi:hypothetical protein ACLOJK_013725 [Asimina triloba]